MGDYIILSAVEQESKFRSWQTNLIASKGINLWNGVVNLRALYRNSDASMMQNGTITNYNSQIINARMGLDFSFWKDMHLRYGITFSQKAMDYGQTSKPATNPSGST